jgi:hypothetical protein
VGLEPDPFAERTDLEDAIVDLYLRRGVTRVDASAYMNLTPSVVRYAASGLQSDASGRVRRKNRVLAKISRPEVAPALPAAGARGPARRPVSSGRLRAEEARLATRVPLAEDVTGRIGLGRPHRQPPLSALLPTIASLRESARSATATPTGSASARPAAGHAAVGRPGLRARAAYVMTGTINQASVESGLSEDGKRMLAEAGSRT